MAEIIIENLRKAFGENTIFRDFSYSFEPQKIYALRGPSGVGKTTLLRLIAGLDTDYEGEIKGGGADRVSMVFQEYRLFSNLSAIDNVAKVSFTEADDDAYKLTRNMLRRLRFTDAEMQLYPSELSGGMKQRVAIARAFLKKSAVILLDEAAKELDAELVSILLELIREASKTRTVIMITHDPDEAEILGATVVEISR